jgi:hypothetical protein
MSWKKRVKLTRVVSTKLKDEEYKRLVDIARVYYDKRIIEALTVSEQVRLVLRDIIYNFRSSTDKDQ